MQIKEKFIALKTIVSKEIKRMLRMWPQTLIPPMITTSLYFLIFGKILFDDREMVISGVSVSYVHYLVPGLVVMAVINNSYGNTSFSLFGAKFQKNIEELLIAPIPTWMIILGFTLGGVFRGLINGVMVLATAYFFEPIDIHASLIALFIAFLISMFFSLVGIVNAIFARNFDDVSWVPAFILTPMVYLGGVFFSVNALPDFWKKIVMFNPIYHFVDIFRYNLIGIGEFHFLSFGSLVIGNIILFTITNFIFVKKLQK
ncbi:ABC transporter permease [Candidatus Bandiella euplotis]|uniref:Transport permease protein n=1 Tax=Candidatus Bandiella euplotis TaxID=1664265 RepID=A0ABZ0ULG8_9RICK|nr:ABC transporter permease [Candidatus Bandiella woodruffii]WPX96792.1 ABC transporter permease [Candidatus Bandiella woodruffii]